MPSGKNMMQAAVIDAFGPPAALHPALVPIPAVDPAGVLVKVRYAGINPIDAKTRSGEGVPVPAFPALLGWDVSGTVVAVGPYVHQFHVGDAVFGMPCFPDLAGAYAQYVHARADTLALKPDNIDFGTAAATPLAALTAWQALFQLGGLGAGQNVLVHGAAGGVGHIAVQLAKGAGAEVTATASPRNHSFLRGLGADRVVEYSGVETLAAEFDLVVDTRGGDDFFRLMKVVRRGGYAVSLLGRDGRRADAERDAMARGVRAAYTLVQPDGNTLSQISGCLQEGSLNVSIESTFPLSEAAAAHSLIEAGHVRGKLVLEIPD